MRIHLETSFSRPPGARAIVHFLNGLLLLRYSLTAMAYGDRTLATLCRAEAEDAPYPGFEGTSPSEGGQLLEALGRLLLNDFSGLADRSDYAVQTYIDGPAAINYGRVFTVPGQTIDDYNPLQRPPFNSFPLEGFVLETLLTGQINDHDFEIITLKRGSVDLVIEDGLEHMQSWLNRMLRPALVAASWDDPAIRQTNRRSFHEQVRTTIHESDTSLSGRDRLITAGVLAVGSESIQRSFANMEAIQVSVTDTPSETM